MTPADAVSKSAWLVVFEIVSFCADFYTRHIVT